MARVLVVDDDGDVLQVVKHVLADEGHEVTGAGSAERARACLLQGHFEVAVIDYWMPLEDGLSLANFLRSEGVPVVMIKGAVEVRELHGRDMPILAKPFSSTELEGALREAMEQTTVPRAKATQ